MQPIFIITVFALFFIGVIIFGAWLSARRRKELGAWAASRGLSFDPAKDHSMESRCPALSALRQGSNRYAYNIIQGSWSERPVLAFDYHYETYSTDSKGNRQTHHHHFSVIALGSDVPLKPLFIRPEGFFDKITEFFGADDIDFESAEFSRKFFVKAEDRRWAYDVIHTRTMEFLLGQPRFSIQFDSGQVYVWRTSTFRPSDFECAIETALGILDRFPEYLVKQLRDNLS